jgi:hypothetical protein
VGEKKYTGIISRVELRVNVELSIFRKYLATVGLDCFEFELFP